MSNFTHLLLAYTYYVYTLAILRPNRVTCWESICSRLVVLLHGRQSLAFKERSEGKKVKQSLINTKYLANSSSAVAVLWPVGLKAK